ncbi:MAG TPA: ABC transporter ATP-binding protein [Candidatus Baltobacteraceae bacterium]
MTGSAVSLAGVGKDYKHFTLDDVSLELPQGSIMGFIGANGAGKSTTIRILMGLIHQDRGTVRVLDNEMPAGQVAAKREIGYVSDDMRLYPGASIAWHMSFIASIFPSWDAAYAAELVKRFDLTPEQRIKGLSHGQRVKAALLLVLARRPRLLVLDEPTTGLDPIARQEVLGALIEVLADERRTVLFSSQNTMDVEQISDRITFIDRGRIVASDDKENYLDRWRRVRFEIPEGATVTAIPGMLDLRGSGRINVVTVPDFTDATLPLLQATGASVIAVEPMSLEEIFLCTVKNRREGVLA